MKALQPVVRRRTAAIHHLSGSGGGVESNLGNARDVSDADKGGGAGERACKQDRVVI